MSQSIDLGDPLGFDEDAEHTDIDLAPVNLPDLPDEVDEPSEEEPATEVGRVVASHSSEEEAETTVSKVSTSGGAAALLQRLRGSTGERRRRRPRGGATAPTPPVSIDDDDDDDDSATVAVRRPRDRPKPPVAQPPPPPDKPAPEPTAEDLEPERVLGKRRPPGFEEPDAKPGLPASDFLDDDTDEGRQVTEQQEKVDEAAPVVRPASPAESDAVPQGEGMRVLAPDGREISVPVAPSECIASVVRRAVARLGLHEVDLQGRPARGWRGRVGEHPLPGSTAAEGIERILLVAEDRSEHRLVVEHAGQRIHLTLPSCLTVGSVLPAIASLFGAEAPLRPTFAGMELPDAVLVGELRRKPLVLEPG